MKYFVEPGGTEVFTKNGEYTIVVGDAQHTITLVVAVGCPAAPTPEAVPPSNGGEFVVQPENFRLGEESGR